MNIIIAAALLSSSTTPLHTQETTIKEAFTLLETTYNMTDESSPLKKQIIEIQKILGNNPKKIQFRYARDNSVLHDRIASVARDAHFNPRLKNIWHKFLEKMHDIKVYYPDGKQLVSLNFHPEIVYLNTLNLPKVKICSLDLTSEISQVDKDMIWNIQNESFGTVELPSRKDFEDWYQNPSHVLLVARNKETNLIEGLLLSKNDTNSLHIYIIARQANAVKKGIGHQLMTEFMINYASKEKTVTLHVREGNKTAQKLYEKFCFFPSGYEIARNSYPKEKNIMMKRSKEAL